MQEARTEMLDTGRRGIQLSRDIQQSLFLLQQKAGARNYAVVRSGTRSHGQSADLSLLSDNFPSGSSGGHDILAAYGDQLVEHVQQCTLPVMWNGADDSSTAETPDLNQFVVRLKGRSLQYSGLALPIKLGAVGNGFVILTSTYLDLSADTIVDLHLQATRAMIALLQSDVRYSKASELLSEREVACLQMAGDGLTSEEVAVMLGLSVHTVNAYLGAATTKLDSVNRIQAIAKAIRLGYIN